MQRWHLLIRNFLKLVYWYILLVLFVLSTDTFLCDMLGTFGSLCVILK